MPLRNTKKELRSLRIFLRERGLLSAFRRSRDIKRKRLVKVKIGGSTQQVVVFKRKGRTIVADPFTLKTISTTKKFNTKNIADAFKTRKVAFKPPKDLKSGKFGEKAISSLRFGEIEREIKTNTIFIRRGTYLRSGKVVGRLTISITFFKGNTRKTVSGSSANIFDLSDRKSREKAFNEAFRGALSMIDFSYDHFIINAIYYDYHHQIPDSQQRLRRISGLVK